MSDNKMKRNNRYYLLLVFVFIVCGVLIFGQLSEIFRTKTGEDSDLVHYIYSMEKNQMDVVFFGSSHGYSSISPNELWHEYGIPACSMCSHGQSVASSYYLLKETLKYQSPKVVFLESYTFCDDSKHRGESYLRMAFDGVRLGKVKYEMIDDFLPDASFGEKLSYYLPFIKYHSRWGELEPYDFHSSDLYLKGTFLKTDTYPIEDPGIPANQSELGEASMEYFEKIVKLCEENEIQLVVYAAPFGIKKSYEDYCYRQGINNTLEVWLKENWGDEIPFLYYQKIGEVDVDFATDFRDTHHMNAYGASKITHHMGEFLQQYGLADHRGEEEYLSWDEDYEMFCQELAKLEEDSQ